MLLFRISKYFLGRHSLLKWMHKYYGLLSMSEEENLDNYFFFVNCKIIAGGHSMQFHGIEGREDRDGENYNCA